MALCGMDTLSGAASVPRAAASGARNRGSAGAPPTVPAAPAVAGRSSGVRFCSSEYCVLSGAYLDRRQGANSTCQSRVSHEALQRGAPHACDEHMLAAEYAGAAAPAAAGAATTCFATGRAHSSSSSCCCAPRHNPPFAEEGAVRGAQSRRRFSAPAAGTAGAARGDRCHECCQRRRHGRHVHGFCCHRHATP